MTSVSAAHQQVLDFLTSGDYYSAHQKARTTATRLLAPPRRNAAAAAPPAGDALPYDAKAQQAAELLWDAARKLLEKGQAGRAGATMLVHDVWTARGVACGKQERGTFGPGWAELGRARSLLLVRPLLPPLVALFSLGRNERSDQPRPCSQDHPAHRPHRPERRLAQNPHRRHLCVDRQDGVRTCRRRRDPRVPRRDPLQGCAHSISNPSPVSTRQG